MNNNISTYGMQVFTYLNLLFQGSNSQATIACSCVVQGSLSSSLSDRPEMGGLGEAVGCPGSVASGAGAGW